MSGTRGVAAGIDHGTMRGYRQHRRRDVPLCPACAQAHGKTVNDKNAQAFSGAEMAVRGLTTAERRYGARYAASRAEDKGDLRDLLSALGLTAADGLPHRTGAEGAP